MLKPVSLFYGTDPEGFFQRDGKIIGSEKVIPKAGLGAKYPAAVVLDGVQFELNPACGATPSILGSHLSWAFQSLKRHLSTIPDISFCFRGVVEVDREELDSLSPETRILGCNPSMNYYGDKPITVDAAVYRKRSAGGHLHLGLTASGLYDPAGSTDHRQKLVPLLDIFVGNTCVLLDRDLGAAERRENYGRAGEYRLPKHGLEYRTLSNFWLRNYALLSLVCGLGHIAVSVLRETVNGNDIEQELINVVNIKNITEAIDKNSYGLARKNFESIRPFLAKHLPDVHDFQLTPRNLDKFLMFCDKVQMLGLPTLFQEDPVMHWCSGRFTDFYKVLEEI